MNKDLFKTNPGNIKSTGDAKNEAGGSAYLFEDKLALSQLVLTGCFNSTFYSSDQDQLKKVLELAQKCDVEFIAKLAIYARKFGYMKDAPALLAAVVSSKDINLFKKIFPLVIDDPKMLRTFVQIVRSGVVGRKSFGSGPKKMIQKFLNGMSDEQLFKANIGTPSLNDIIKMVRPKAANEQRNALYAYLIGKAYNEEHLNPLVREFEAFKKDMNRDIPNVPFQMLTALPLTDNHWKALAMRSTWTQLRLNLNSFQRHNVFSDKEVVNHIAKTLSDPEQVKRAKVFPYQLFSTFINMTDEVPAQIKLALQAAAEVSIENTPSMNGDIVIALDCSGSMTASVSGNRGSATSKMRCIDVASMFASAILRKNPLAKIIPFDTKVKNVDINPLDSVMTNAQKLAQAGGGTSCEVPLMLLNEHNAKVDAIIMISDNQSFVQSAKTYHGETPMMREWQKLHNRNKHAKLVCIDIAPYANSQVYDTDSTINCGGFSDQIFDVVADFIKGDTKDALLKKIEAVPLDNQNNN